MEKKLGLSNPTKKKKFKKSVEEGGLGQGFWDFLENIEEVVGYKSMIQKGEHVKLKEKYKQQKFEFEVEDEKEDELSN